MAVCQWLLSFWIEGSDLKREFVDGTNWSEQDDLKIESSLDEITLASATIDGKKIDAEWQAHGHSPQSVVLKGLNGVLAGDLHIIRLRMLTKREEGKRKAVTVLAVFEKDMVRESDHFDLDHEFDHVPERANVTRRELLRDQRLRKRGINAYSTLSVPRKKERRQQHTRQISRASKYGDILGWNGDLPESEVKKTEPQERKPRLKRRSFHSWKKRDLAAVD